MVIANGYECLSQNDARGSVPVMTGLLKQPWWVCRVICMVKMRWLMLC